MEKSIDVPLSDDHIRELRAGDIVYLTGTIYTARDAAHARMQEALRRSGDVFSESEPEAGLVASLPFDIRGSIIYYMGPSPARPGRVIGSAGPTTSGRMDAYTPQLLDLGLKGMIGKGRRTEEVREAIVRNGAIYFAAVGGAGALLSKSIVSSEVIAYDDLGTEAIRRLEVRNFPVIVAIDCEGNDIYAPQEQGENRQTKAEAACKG